MHTRVSYVCAEYTMDTARHRVNIYYVSEHAAEGQEIPRITMHGRSGERKYVTVQWNMLCLGWHRVYGLVYLVILKGYDVYMHCILLCVTRQKIIRAQRIRIGELNSSFVLTNQAVMISSWDFLFCFECRKILIRYLCASEWKSRLTVLRFLTSY